ncbi:hypothetical protein [Oceanobacillus chungangensis]|uniref:Replication-relaxation n=1 Tax=Oceanobacillus chungangensis TaxID=1229152 RepID=A0A3D8PJU6_9BACI|nr:hypothetical protein [Oceanobacillus chungangensis]RDW15942.1 hypothetical protein CWR45_15720 [Oceanobacillus chungangensis]
MNKRDLQLIDDLHRFRVMSRNDIADLYFSHLKSPITSANIVLKRLVRDKQIDVSKAFSPYVYFPIQSNMKRNSTKIPHFLKIVEIYKQLQQHTKIDSFIVEPKYKKGLAEPDILVTIKGKQFYIEVQRNLYSQKVMDQKIKRYEALKYSNEFTMFPFIIMVSDTRYEINSDVTVFQVSSIHEFMNKVRKKEQAKQPVNEIKFKIG